VIKTKLAVVFTVLVLAALGLTAIFAVYAPHQQTIGVGQVDSALGGSWLRENNESFVFSVLANNSVRIKYFNGSVQNHTSKTIRGRLGACRISARE